MQYVNDDMDELFRRAAEDYPLDANSADWNKVLAALQGETGEKAISEKKGNNNRRLLWLLLLLPLGLICNRLYSPGVLNGKEVSKTSAESKKTPVENNTTHQDRNTNEMPITNNDLNPNGSQSRNSLTTSDQGKDNLYTVNPVQLKNRNRGHNSYSDAFSMNSQTENNENDLTTDESLYQRRFISIIDFQKSIPDDFKTAVNKNFNPLISTSEQNPKQAIPIQKRKKFYAGIVGGVDATTIKFQKIENAGATYGALFGYQFNKKWSIETGAFFEKKYYYSEGKYFNTSKIYMRPNSTIDDVYGNCNMVEVPVSVKYNFPSHKNSGWFVTVGSSSYFMKKEDYTYNVYYGTVGPVAHHIPYDSSSTYLFSNISISGGYMHRLGHFADLHIEPYIKVPLSGVGIGSLPLFSTGLQIGITKKF